MRLEMGSCNKAYPTIDRCFSLNFETTFQISNFEVSFQNNFFLRQLAVPNRISFDTFYEIFRKITLLYLASDCANLPITALL